MNDYSGNYQVYSPVNISISGDNATVNVNVSPDGCFASGQYYYNSLGYLASGQIIDFGSI